MKEHISESAEETFELGKALGQQLAETAVICFFGELAAGKTTFIKGLALGAAQIDPFGVQSPTFTYLNIYKGNKTIYHFDLYRLHDIDEFLSMGFDEYFDSHGICCIEWSERIAPFLPRNSIAVYLEHIDSNQRLIKITNQLGHEDNVKS